MDGKDLSGLSFLKMSIRNEIDAPGVKSLRPDFQNVFRNTLAYWCNEILTANYCFIDNVEDMKDVDAGMYDFMISRGVKSKYGISIKNSNGILIGFICIEYMIEYPISVKEISKILQVNKTRIEALLNFSVHQKGV